MMIGKNWFGKVFFSVIIELRMVIYMIFISLIVNMIDMIVL